MKFNLIIIFIFIFTVTQFSQQNKSVYIQPPQAYRIFTKNIFNERDHLRQEIERKQKEKELMREQKRKERVRKIINEHLMPLTKGNSFMKDFYSGRY